MLFASFFGRTRWYYIRGTPSLLLYDNNSITNSNMTFYKSMNSTNGCRFGWWLLTHFSRVTTAAVITTKSKSSATMHGPVDIAIDAIAFAHPSQSREVRLLQGPRNRGNLSAKAFLLVSSRRGHRRIRTAGTFHHLAAIIYVPEYVTQAERVQHVRTCTTQSDVLLFSTRCGHKSPSSGDVDERNKVKR